MKSVSIKERLSEQLDLIYNDISSKYDRAMNQATEESPVQIVSGILEDFWNIPSNISIHDFEWEKDRQNKHKIEIPDIPTYKIRFAIEEGSWIVLLRNHFRPLLRDEFNRLLTLEDLIWNSGAAKLDDLSYYVIELQQVGEKWILPIYQLWKSNHDYGKWKDFAPLLIASVHQVIVQRGELMFEGGFRLYRSKLRKLNAIEQINGPSMWVDKSRQILDGVKTDIEKAGDDELTNTIITTLAIFQKELQTRSNTVQNTAKEEDTTRDVFNWQQLDPSNIEDRDEFGEYLITKLYLRPEENPIDAAKALITTELTSQDYSDKQIKELVDRFSTLIEPNDVEEIIEKIQSTIIKLLLDVKRFEIEEAKHHKNLKEIDQLDIWDAFEDNLVRIKRIGETDRKEEQLNKSIDNLYNYLLERDLEPTQIFEYIMDGFIRISNIDNGAVNREIPDLNNDMPLNIYDQLIQSKIKSEIANILWKN